MRASMYIVCISLPGMPADNMWLRFFILPTVCISLFRQIRSSQKDGMISLSPEETILIPAEAYFTGPFSDFYLNRTTAASASIRKSSNVTELFEVEIDEGWRMGPTLNANFTVYFTLFSPKGLEIWTFEGGTLEKKWTTLANISKVSNVNLHESSGFVYSTLPMIELFFVDVLSDPITVRQLQGVNTTDASHITICSEVNNIGVVGNNGDLWYYKVDYVSAIAWNSSHNVISQPVIDSICNYLCYYLIPAGFFRMDGIYLKYWRLSPSLGNYTAMKPISASSEVQILAEKGVARTHLVIDSTNHWQMYTSNIKQILKLGSYTIAVEKHANEEVLIVKDFTSQIDANCKIVLERNADGNATKEYVWLKSGQKHSNTEYLLRKTQTKLTLLALIIGRMSLKVSVQSTPFTFDLCAFDELDASNYHCRNITVVLIADLSAIILRTANSNGTLDLTISLESHNITHRLSGSDMFSGPNLNYSLSFPELPSFLNVSTSFLSSIYILNEKKSALEPGYRALCGCFQEYSYRYVLYNDLWLIETAQMDTIFNSSLRLSNAKCAMDRHSLYICGEDTHAQWWLYHYPQNELLELKQLPSSCESILLTESILVLVLQSQIDVLERNKDRWTSVKSDEIICIAAYSDIIAIHTGGKLEILALVHDRIVNVQKVSVSQRFSRLALSGNTLIALSTDNELIFYDISPAFHITQKFSFITKCSVLDIRLNAEIAILRCEDFIQFFSVNSPKRDAMAVRIPRNTTAVSLLTLPNYYQMAEFSYDGNEYHFSVFYISFNAQIQLTIQITDSHSFRRSISFLGEMTVANYEGESLLAVINVTVENLNDLVAVTPSNIPNIIELPWRESLTLPKFSLFRGNKFQLELRSHPSSAIKLTNSITTQFSVDFNLYLKGGTSVPSLDLHFLLLSEEVIVVRTECTPQSCSISSSRSISLSHVGFISFRSLLFAFAIGSQAYFRFVGTERQNEMNNFRDGLIMFDSETNLFTVKRIHAETHTIILCHIMKVSDEKYRVIFYGTVLELCTITSVSLICSEIVIDNLVDILSISSERIAAGSFHVYFLTGQGFLCECELSEILSCMRWTSINTSKATRSIDMVLIGTKAILPKNDGIDIYSLPEFTLLREIRFNTIYPSIDYCNLSAGEEANFLAAHLTGHHIAILDLRAPHGCAMIGIVKAKSLCFVSATRIVGILDTIYTVLDLAEGGIYFDRSATQSETIETDVEIWAMNDVRNVSYPAFRVRRYASSREMWETLAGLCVLVGVGGFYHYWRRRGNLRNSSNDVELTSLTAVAKNRE